MNNLLTPGTELEPAYRTMAFYTWEQNECQRLGQNESVDYWDTKLAGAQNILRDLTGEWPIAYVVDANSVVVSHGDYRSVHIISA